VLIEFCRLYDDTAKKGSVIIQGMEEVTVHNKNEVLYYSTYNLLTI